MSSIGRELSVLVPFSDNNPEEEDRLRQYPLVQVKQVVYSNIDDNTLLLDYVKQVKKTVKDTGISSILTLSDISTFVHSAVVRDFPSVSGPSVEACFLAFHKAYTREHLEPTAEPIPYCVVDLDSPTVSTDARKALDTVGFPACVKPATGYASFGVKRVNSCAEMSDALDSLRTVRDEHPNFLTSPSASFFRSYYEEYLDVTKYSLALRDVVVVEPYMEAEAMYAVDGCVINGTIVHWAIADTLRFDEEDARFASMILPTAADDGLQGEIWRLYDAVLTRMIQFGFDNSFAMIEVFKMKDGEIRLVEVNARANRLHHAVYSACLEPGLQDHASMSAACGIGFSQPAPTGKHGIVYPVFFKKPEKPGNLMDFDVIKKLQNDSDVEFLLLAGPDDDMSDLLSSTHFCAVTVCADSRQAMMNRLVEVLRLTVKKPEKLTYPMS
ncbi:uncharacterized protein [Branchiostoma lanceolatum]|uniref:uncharacterized protein n=1 Tax=Branchiostoma lanceolatum TaxID=7740 RepID=UPI003455A26D